MNLKTKLAFLFLGFGLLACEPSERHGDELLGGGCLSDTDLLVNVVIMKDSFEVEKAYVQYLKDRGQRVDKKATRAAFCVIRSNNTRTCYLPALRGQRDDERMFLWGHEFAHVVCGDWHPQDFTVIK